MRTTETLLIEGPDAVAFAHAQFSSKVTALAVGQWQFSAWLDPQGRVLALFHLARLGEDKLLLLLRGGEAAVMMEALRRFVFRSRLTLNASSSGALATGDALALHEVRIEGTAVSLGCGSHALRMTPLETGDSDWHLPQLRLGWPWLPNQALGKYLSPMLSLQRLQAAAIDKGCYPGQEIVARLHFRGGCKRHLYGATLSQPVAAGETLRIDNQDIGMVLDVVVDETIEALMVLNDEAVTNMPDGGLPLECN
ncbi:MAG: CAF17-like 4Fe-4S cluster assembly/insertion protein YgfZ, partial [Rhodanobacter sp.]